MIKIGIAYVSISNSYNSYIGSNVSYKIRKFSSCKTLDNIFFENKNKIVEVIDKFINNREYYLENGIPYNLGIMLYGEPGCGKSSFIKALSNYINRHIFQFNLSQVKTCKDFETIMFDNSVNNLIIPTNTRMYVIEDIDTMVDYVLERSTEDKNHDLDSNTIIQMSMLKSMENISNTKSTLSDSADQNLNLSFILNTLDGINEQDGRIFIITTNYPDRLDKALIRPGRFDIKIGFKKCSNVILHQMINYYYKTTINSNITFPDYKYTPAEVMNVCVLQNLTLDQAIEKLQI